MGNWYGYYLHYSHELQAYIGRRMFLAIIVILDILLVSWAIRSALKKERNSKPN